MLIHTKPPGRLIGGNELTRVVAAAYQARLTPSAAITNEGSGLPPDMAAKVFCAVQRSRRPITGRQLELATGFRGDPTSARDKIRQWEQLRAAEAATQQLPAWLQKPQPPAWLNPPTWLTDRAHNRR